MTQPETSDKLKCYRGAIIFVICLILGIFSAIWLTLSLLHPWGSDFQIYYQAVHQAQAGASAYFPYVLGKSFVYYPFALTLLSLSTPLGQTLALYIWTVLNAVAYSTSIYFALQLSDRPTTSKRYGSAIGGPVIVASILLVFAPFWSTILIGQINGLVTLGLVLSLYFAEDQKDVLAGLCLALATAMKLSPVLLLVYFLCIRRYRIFLSTVLALLLFTLIAWLQFGTSVLTDFLTVLSQMSTVIDPHYYNQGSLSMILRLLMYFGIGVSDTMTAGVHKLILATFIGISLLSGLLIPPDAQRPRRWLFALLVSLMIISSPLVWYHHSIFILLPLVWLLVDPRPFYLTSGVVILFLIQSEYIYEMQLAAYSNVVFFNFSGLPVVVGQILLFIVLAIAYCNELQMARRASRSGMALEATEHCD